MRGLGAGVPAIIALAEAGLGLVIEFATVQIDPDDLVATTGLRGGGLDPHLSLEGALWQVPRIARARGVSPERVRAAVEAQIEPRTFGFLGEPRINVLLMNLALDRQFGPPTGERVGMP